MQGIQITKIYAFYAENKFSENENSYSKKFLLAIPTSTKLLSLNIINAENKFFFLKTRIV
jgi:hypothetical protein